MERGSVDPSSISNGTMDMNCKSHKYKDDKSLPNVEWKLKQATGAFRQEVMNRYMLKKTGDSLVHTQNILIKATNEFCSKMQKDSTSEMASLHNSADKSQEKNIGRVQADSKNKLKVDTAIPHIVQLDIKYNATKNVNSTSLHSANEKSDIPFEPPKTANTKTALTKTTTSTTLDYKPQFYTPMWMTKTNTEIVCQNPNKERKEIQLIDDKVTNNATRETRPETKPIDHKTASLLLNKEEKKSDANTSTLKTESLKDQAFALAKADCLLNGNAHDATTNVASTLHLNKAIPLERCIQDQSKNSMNELLKQTISNVLIKPKAQKVDKLVALNLLEKLKVERELEEVQDTNTETKSGETVEKDRRILRPYYDNDWVQRFYLQRYKTLVENKPQSRSMFRPEKDNTVNNEINPSGKFPTNCLQSVIPPLKTETNKSNISSQLSSHKIKCPMSSTKLYDLGETESKRITEQEVALYYTAQKILIARPNRKNKRYNDTMKRIKQRKPRRREVKTSQLGELELLLDKPKENLEKKIYLSPGSIEQEADNVHNPPIKTHTEVNEMPLSVLLKIVRSRNQAKKARDAVMAVFGTKFLEEIVRDCPTSSDCKRRNREGLYIPSYKDEASESSNATKTEKQKPEPECPPLDKCVSTKDIFNKPREIVAGRTALTISDELITIKYINKDETNSLRPEILNNRESVQDTEVTARHFEPWGAVPIDGGVEILPKNNSFSLPRIIKQKATTSLIANLWRCFYSNYDN